jgi:hypothetical protein
MALEPNGERPSGEPGDVRGKLREVFRKTKQAPSPAKSLNTISTPLKDAAPPPNVEPPKLTKPLLETVEAARPPDVGDRQWRTAMKGLEAFLAGGHGDQAERLGWPKDELYRVPPVWARVDLCGAGLLVADSTVVAITSVEIRIKTVGGATQVFHRAPEPDLALIYRERLKQTRCDSAQGDEEAKLRAIEHVVSVYRAHCARRGRACTLEEATAAVKAAIARKGKTSWPNRRLNNAAP